MKIDWCNLKSMIVQVFRRLIRSTKHEARGYPILILFLFISSCAIQVPPTGGPGDTVAPKVLKSVPENYSLNTKPSDIILTFDEFIQLKDISTQLVVSPLLKYPPETRIKKKSLIIHLSDTLADNTTYTLNFGNSIVDNNESNALESYQFVFSTGSVVDSLKISGKVEFAFDHKTDKGLFALIYKENKDSLPFNERPMYFAKTDLQGRFTINNITPGKYKLVVLQDKDGNYLYTPGEESIGFADSMIVAGDSSVSVRMFKEPYALHLTKTASVSPGKAYIVFSAAADSLKINWLTDLKKLDVYSQEFSEQKDTLTILYKNTEMDSLSFYYWNGKRNDTVDIRLFKNSTQQAGKGRKFELTFDAVDADGSHHFHLPYKIRANHPLAAIDTKGIILKKDSVEQKDFKVDFSDSAKYIVQLSSKWDAKAAYELFVPPGSIQDIYGLKNDSLKFNWTVKPETYYGTLLLNISVKENLIVQLINEKEEIIRQSFISNDTAIQYTYLDPMVYRIKVIHDENSNHKWDSGNLLKRVQPEYTEYYPEMITVRANWDVDVKWDMSANKTKQ